MTEHVPEVKLNIVTDYIADQFPENTGKYAFAYHITLTNTGDCSVQLINRYWLITDGNGKTTEVAGPGVVGKQPLLVSGSSFSYTSGAVLDTPVGTMQGHYEMETEEGKRFHLPIPVFRLAVPQLLN